MNRNAFFAGVVLATCIPIAAFAQIAAPTASPDPIAMCKELRSKAEAAQTDARNAAFQALSSAHRAQVQSIIDRVKAGKLDPRTATGQIDDLLTVDETKAVLAQQDKLQQTMRSLLESRPGVRSIRYHRWLSVWAKCGTDLVAYERAARKDDATSPSLVLVRAARSAGREQGSVERSRTSAI